MNPSNKLVLKGEIYDSLSHVEYLTGNTAHTLCYHAVFVIKLLFVYMAMMECGLSFGSDLPTFIFLLVASLNRGHCQT